MEQASVDTQQANPQTMKYTWTIEHFSKRKARKLYSDVFTVGGYKWRILIFPKGNKVDYLSMYLDVADSQTLPYGWTIYADFSLGLVNQIHEYSIRKETQHHFCIAESDWGFASFVPLSDLSDPSRGYLVDDTVSGEAVVSVGKALCPVIPAITETSHPQEEAKNDEATMLPEANLDAKPALIVEDEVSIGKALCPVIPAITETSQPQEEAKNDEAPMLHEANLDAKPALQDEMLGQLYKMKLKVETQKDASQIPMPSVQDDGCSDVTLRRLSAAEELLRSTSEIPQSAEALAALDTVKRIAGSSLATLCVDGAYEEFTTGLTLLTEKGVIPSKIASMLKDLLQSLEGGIPNYVADEKELDQGESAQHVEIKTQMELAMQKCHEIKDSLANYDAKVAELEAELVAVKAKRAETMANLKTAVDEVEPLRQRFADSYSRSESFTVRQAMYGASLGTWVVVQDVLKNLLKF